MKTEFSVNITKKDLFAFLMSNTYKKFTGVMWIVFSIVCVGIAIYTWGDVKIWNSIILIFAASFYTIINPILLYSKAKRQIKNNDYFNNTLMYAIDEKGIEVVQGEDKVSVKWDEIWKAVKCGSIVAVYITTIRAFILPIRCMGDKYNDFVDLARQGLSTRCKLSKKK